MIILNGNILINKFQQLKQKAVEITFLAKAESFQKTHLQLETQFVSTPKFLPNACRKIFHNKNNNNDNNAIERSYSVIPDFRLSYFITLQKTLVHPEETLCNIRSNLGSSKLETISILDSRSSNESDSVLLCKERKAPDLKHGCVNLTHDFEFELSRSIEILDDSNIIRSKTDAPPETIEKCKFIIS